MIKTIETNIQYKVNTAKCPDCDSTLKFPGDIEKGEILSCPGCGIELEVKKISNGGECIELEEFTLEGEDWGE